MRIYVESISWSLAGPDVSCILLVSCLSQAVAGYEKCTACGLGLPEWKLRHVHEMH